MPTQVYSASTIIQADGVIVVLVKLQWPLTHGPSRASRLRLQSWLARSELASQLLAHRLANSTSASQSKKTWRVQNSQIRIRNGGSISIIWFTRCISRRHGFPSKLCGDTGIPRLPFGKPHALISISFCEMPTAEGPVLA